MTNLGRLSIAHEMRAQTWLLQRDRPFTLEDLRAGLPEVPTDPEAVPRLESWLRAKAIAEKDAELTRLQTQASER